MAGLNDANYRESEREFDLDKAPRVTSLVITENSETRHAQAQTQPRKQTQTHMQKHTRTKTDCKTERKMRILSDGKVTACTENAQSETPAKRQFGNIN